MGSDRANGCAKRNREGANMLEGSFRRQPKATLEPPCESGAQRGVNAAKAAAGGFARCNLGGTTEHPRLRPCFGGEGYSFFASKYQTEWGRENNAMDRA